MYFDSNVETFEVSRYQRPAFCAPHHLPAPGAAALSVPRCACVRSGEGQGRVRVLVGVASVDGLCFENAFINHFTNWKRGEVAAASVIWAPGGLAAAGGAPAHGAQEHPVPPILLQPQDPAVSGRF